MSRTHNSYGPQEVDFILKKPGKNTFVHIYVLSLVTAICIHICMLFLFSRIYIFDQILQFAIPKLDT